MNTVTVSLASSDIQSVNDNPFQLVAAQGDGTIIIPKQFTYRSYFGTVVYDVNSVGWNYRLGSAWFPYNGFSLQPLFLGAPQNVIYWHSMPVGDFGIPGSFNNIPMAEINNGGLFLTGVMGSAVPLNGDGTLEIDIEYDVANIAQLITKYQGHLNRIEDR